MIGQQHFTEIIEHLRIQKKLSYHFFLEGIVSERSYRRYVNEGKPFNFQVLVLLVEKLQMKMRDFIIFSINHISIKHQKEIYLAHYLDHQMIEEAQSLIDEVKPPFYTHLGAKILPSLLKRYDYMNHKIDIYAYHNYLKSQVNLPLLKKRMIVDRNTLKVLLLLLEDGSLDVQSDIIPILYDVMLGNKQLVSHQFDVDLNAMIQTLSHVLFSNETLSKTFSSYVEEVFIVSMKHTRNFHLDTGFLYFFKDALLYIKKDHSSFSSFVMYYLITQKLHKKDYRIPMDTFLLNLVSMDEIKPIIENTSFNSLYFMKEGLI